MLNAGQFPAVVVNNHGVGGCSSSYSVVNVVNRTGGVLSPKNNNGANNNNASNQAGQRVISQSISSKNFSGITV